MNTFTKAARYVLINRMTKRAFPFSEKQVRAFEEMAKQGILPEPIIQVLEQKAQDAEPESMWDKIKRRSVQGMGVGAGLGVIGGGIRGIANQEGVADSLSRSVGSGLWNAGLGSLIGGGIGALESYFPSNTSDEEREQARRILQQLQEARASQADTTEVPPEAPATMNSVPVPVFNGGGLPTINYNIHNFGPQLLQR